MFAPNPVIKPWQILFIFMGMPAYRPYLMEYKRFMVSFKLLHRELYMKYHKLFEIDFHGSGRVKIKEADDIRASTRLVLTYILKEYYNPLDN